MAPHKDPKPAPEIGFKKQPKKKPKASPWASGPTVETRNPYDFIGKVPISKLFNLPQFSTLRMILTPSMLAEPWLDEITPEQTRSRTSEFIKQQNVGLDDMIVQPEVIEEYEFELPTEPVAEPQFIRPQVPIVPWYSIPEKGPYITKSPKIGTIVYRPPKYHVPPPYLVEVPQNHPMFAEPTPLEIPPLLKEFELETKPQVDQAYDLPPIGKTNVISDRVINIEISTDTKMLIMNLFRN